MLFSLFMYNINPNHNFNQTYHNMIFDKQKKKSNHNFNQTHILYESTIAKVIFQNYFYQTTTTIIKKKTHFK